MLRDKKHQTPTPINHHENKAPANNGTQNRWKFSSSKLSLFFFHTSWPKEHAHEYKTAEILKQPTQTGTSRDDYHYSASSKYSNSIRGDTKGLIRADELPSRVPFFLLLLIAAISGCVGEMPLDNSPLSNEPIFHVYAGRDTASNIWTLVADMIEYAQVQIQCCAALLSFVSQFELSAFLLFLLNSANKSDTILAIKSVQRHLDNKSNSDLCVAAMNMEISLQIVKWIEPQLDECEAFIRHSVTD
ncbi:hypothetical protein ABVT39_017861 [Epinephelus coioides]